MSASHERMFNTLHTFHVPLRCLSDEGGGNRGWGDCRNDWHRQQGVLLSLFTACSVGVQLQGMAQGYLGHSANRDLCLATAFHANDLSPWWLHRTILSVVRSGQGRGWMLGKGEAFGRRRAELARPNGRLRGATGCPTVSRPIEAHWGPLSALSWTELCLFILGSASSHLNDKILRHFFLAIGG